MPTVAEILRAIYRKDYPFLERLTQEEASALDGDGRTPLMHAVLSDDLRAVRALLQRGAATDAADHAGKWTALHFAAADKDAAAVRALLEAGAPVDPQDTSGNTPLWRAVMSPAKNPDVLRALVGHGADPAKKNASGNSPIDVARRAGLREVERILRGG